MILLHGYGSHEGDLAGLAPMLPPELPWASLRAPIEMGYGGAAWFPLLDIEVEPDPVAVVAATDALWSWVDEHVGGATPLIPVGFSQGGFMAIQMLRTRPDRIAATVVLAGFTTAARQSGDDAVTAARPEVFWGRGDADLVVPASVVERSEAWLADHVSLRVHVYRGLAHGINEQEMADARDYVADSLTARDA